jgi:LDH2 family malate/lactate/ureidoglycolate dehydrogenase
MQTKDDVLRIDAMKLLGIYQEVARAHGADAEEQRIFADCLLRADLRGHPTQGVALLPYMDELFEAGTMHFGRPLEVVRESPSMAVLDGHGGSGHVIATRTMEKAIGKARDTGVGFVTVRNSGDCGMMSNYPLQAAEEKMIGVAMTTGPLLVAPWGGREVKFSTNPISIAVPAGEHDPIVIDMATSAESMGMVVLAARDGKRLPAATVVDAEGHYTDDPTRVILNPMDRESRMSGALLPAGPKSFGMVLMVEMLAALLSGERKWDDGCCPAAEGTDRSDLKRSRDAYYAQSFLALSVEFFQPLQEFLAASDRMIMDLTTTPPARGFERVRLHDQGAGKLEHEYRSLGVPVRREEWAMVERTLARLRSKAGDLPR